MGYEAADIVDDLGEGVTEAVIGDRVFGVGGAGVAQVITIADVAGARNRDHDARLSRGDSGRAIYALAQVGDLVESGRFSLPVGQTFPLADAAEAHRVGESGLVRGKLVLTVG